MPLVKGLDGNAAAAHGAKLAKVQTVIAYPITPQTELVTYIADMIRNGEIEATYLPAEGEHSVMAALAAASATGARAFTGTCGQGLAFMTENVYCTLGRRVPVVMCVPSRSICCPGGGHTAHCDSMLQRDSGWIQLYCESNQEVFDTVIQAYKIAEDPRVYLPVMVMYEGHGLAHTTMPVSLPDQSDVDEFLPPYKHEWYSMEPYKGKQPTNYAASKGWRSAQRGRYLIRKTLDGAQAVIKEVNEDFGKKFGRKYGNGLVEKYRCDGVKAVLVTTGCLSGAAKDVVDEMREEGKPVGLVRLKSFRPFPAEDLREVGKKVGAMAVLDRNNPYGGIGGGIICQEIASSLYSLENRPLLMSYHTGVARYTDMLQIREIAESVFEASEKGEVINEVNWVWNKGETLREEW